MKEINAAALTMTTLDEREVIRHHCAFIPYKNLSKFCEEKRKFWSVKLEKPLIGLLIVTDWFMDKNQLDFLHLFFYGKLDEINEHVLLLRMGLKKDPSPEHMCVMEREELTGELSSVTNFSIQSDKDNYDKYSHDCYHHLFFPKFYGSDTMQLYVNFQCRHDSSIKFTLHSSIFGLFDKNGVKA
jgi:hypothetical protein